MNSLMLSRTLNPQMNLNWDEWLISEKLDGVRVYYSNGGLYTRNKKRIYAPEWFVKPLLDIPYMLDGELYMGRNTFQELVSVVRKIIPTQGWEKVKFMVFDVILYGFPFTSRIELYESLCNSLNCDWIKPVQHFSVGSANEMWKHFREVVNNGGEGLMLKHKKCFYEHRRSALMLKVKNHYLSTAEVVRIVGGTGKYEGLMGSLQCKWNGKTIYIGTGFTDAERANPPKVGSLVEFCFESKTRDGMPRFPSYKGILREREEVR